MSYINQVIPNVGVAGRYVVATPFDAVISSSKNYTCVRVQDYPTATADLENTLFENVYQPRGLTQELMTAHARAGVFLVTLQDDAGDRIYVPSSYITGIPSTNTTAYNCLLVTAQLGPLPITENIGSLRDHISDAIADQYGITPLISVVRYGASEQVTPAMHQAIIAIRNRRKIQINTKSAQINLLKSENAKLKAQIVALVKVVKDNNLVV